jgi:Fe-S oxidoreductase
MIVDLRAKIVEKRGLSWTKNIAYRSILGKLHLLNTSVKTAATLQNSFLDSDGQIRWLPPPLTSLTNTITLPSIAKKSLQEMLKDSGRPGTARKKIALFTGCLTNYVYPDLGLNLIKAMKKYNFHPYFPPSQTCCGAPTLYDGVTDTAVNLAKINTATLEAENPDYVVTVCPGCAVMLQKEYPRLLKGEVSWKQRAELLADKVRDFSQLIIELSPNEEKKAGRDKKITYHDPCHLRRGLGIYKEPRQLLQREGYEIVEMEDCDVCCGFSGKAVIDYPELSNSVLQRKLDKITASGVDTVVTNCVTCVLQLRGGLDKRNSQIKVVHSAELIAGQDI